MKLFYCLKFRLSMLSLFLFSFLLLIQSCKKIDTNDYQPANTQIDSDVTQRFFSLPQNASVALRRTAAEMQKRNTQKEFVTQFVKNNGYPVWDKAIINSLPANSSRVTASGFINEEGDTTVILPVISATDSSIRNFIIAELDSTIALNLYRGGDYSIYTYDQNIPADSINAHKAALQMMWLNYIVFGTENFIINDNNLFPQIANTQPRIIKIKTVSEPVVQGRQITLQICTSQPSSNGCSCGHGDIGMCVCATNGCCWDTNCTYIFFGGGGGGGTGGGTGGTGTGGTGTGGTGTGGTGGGGGGTPPPNPFPCPSGQNFGPPPPCNTSPLPPVIPYSPLLFLQNILNLNPSQVTWLSLRPDRVSELWSYLELFPVSNSIQIAKDHLVKMMADPAYLYFVENHASTTTDPNSMWWADDLWLDNPQNFNLDIDGMASSAPLQGANPAEKALLKSYPGPGLLIYHNSLLAKTKTEYTMGSSGLNDNTDAFRHAFYQAINVKSVGATITQLFADAHETTTPPQLQLEKEMDLFNNSIGIAYSQSISNITLNSVIATAIWNKVIAGELRYLNPRRTPLQDPNYWGLGGTYNPQTARHGLILIPTFEFPNITQIIPTN